MRQPDKEGGSERSPLVEHRSGNNVETPSLSSLISFSIIVMSIWLQDPVLSLIDTTVLGRTNPSDLAALGPASQVCDGAAYLFFFIPVATTNLFGASRAQGKVLECREIVFTSVWVSATAGLFLFTVMECFGLSILNVFMHAASGDVLYPAFSYVRIRAFSSPASLIAASAKGILLVEKDTVGPLLATAISGMVNLIGDLILVNMLGYGIQGTAVATALAVYSSAFTLLLRVYNTLYRYRDPADAEQGAAPVGGVWATVREVARPPRPEYMMRLLYFVTPCLIQFSGKIGVYGLMTHVASSFGQDALAAHQITFTVYMMLSPPSDSLSLTAQSFLPAVFFRPQAGSPEGTESESTPKAPPVRNIANSWALQKQVLLLSVVYGIVCGVTAFVVTSYFAHAFCPGSAPGELQTRATVVGLSPYLAVAVLLLPPIGAAEGILIAMRELRFIGTAYMLTQLANILFFVEKRITADRSLSVGPPAAAGSMRISSLAEEFVVDHSDIFPPDEGDIGIGDSKASENTGGGSLGSFLSFEVWVANVWQILILYQLLRIALFFARVISQNGKARRLAAEAAHGTAAPTARW
eukprot:GHVU01033769.1.p1 GENE.GHVU01033769.1~~GHVU01033769.1.p1  ORF type:complete len:582 (-),score=45.95 GHVU01033769.1:305-2050(-)